MNDSVQFLPKFVVSLLIELSVLIFTFFVGMFCLFIVDKKILRKNKNLSELFLSVFLGISVIGVFTAIVISRGKTIFIFLPLLVVLLGWATKSSVKVVQRNLHPLNLKPRIWISLLLLVNIIAFLFTYYFLIFRTNGGLNCDHVFYGQVSYSLGHTGIETTNFSWLKESRYLNPYHYLELWYVSLAQNVFNLGPGAYVLVWYPISITLVFFGIALLTDTLYDDIIVGNHRLVYVILGVIFFFILIPGTRLFSGSNNNFDDLKSALATSLLILIYYTYITRGIYLALCVSLAMIFVYPTITPAIYSGVVSAVIFMLAKKKRAWLIPASKVISMASVFVALFCGFYYMQGFFSSGYMVNTGESQQSLSGIIINLLYQLGIDLIYVFIYFIPVFIIIFLISVLTKSRAALYRLVRLLWQEKVILVFICSGLFFSKFVSLAGVNINPDLFQTYSIFYDLLVHLTLFSLIIWLVVNYFKERRVYFISISLLLFLYFLFTLINSPSHHFFKPSSEKFEPELWSEIYNTVNKDDRRFVFIPNNRVIRNSFEKNNLLVYPLQRMIWIKNNYFPVNITEIQDMKDTKSSENTEESKTVATSEKKNTTSAFHTSFQKEFNFIEKNKVGFIIVENGAYIDPGWGNFIKKRISGERYSLLCLNNIESNE
jgi:hypothetical protein